MAFATVNSRRPSQPAAAASGPPVACASGHSMLDWPEATHTSPNHTSSSVIVLRPAIVRVNGPPAGCGGRSTLHRPSAAAVASPRAAPTETRTVSRGRGPAPDAGRRVALQDHVAAHERGQAHVGARRGADGEGENDRARRRAHGRHLRGRTEPTSPVADRTMRRTAQGASPVPHWRTESIVSRTSFGVDLDALRDALEVALRGDRVARLRDARDDVDGALERARRPSSRRRRRSRRRTGRTACPRGARRAWPCPSSPSRT